MEIQSTTTSYAPRPAEAVGVIAPVVALPQPPSEPLGPATTLDLRSEPKTPSPAAAEAGEPQERRYSVDPESRQIVFQIFDSGSGTVVEQLPDESTLRARAYARETLEARQNRGTTTVDRSA